MRVIIRDSCRNMNICSNGMCGSVLGGRNDVNKQRKNSPENLVVSQKTLIFATN